MLRVDEGRHEKHALDATYVPDAKHVAHAQHAHAHTHDEQVNARVSAGWPSSFDRHWPPARPAKTVKIASPAVKKPSMRFPAEGAPA
ncbi:hypothetical protein MHEC_11200 [Mycobacterium heckeshornense]|uniref:Uncharacterized protein n=1 Tax=Mycobacterium heckeshornense TaxID=110505 RepID=A0A7R7JGP2_9MYCO|nr:hypothetical protein MHEC_11200 [Mycobacterium heckeshornense]